MDLQKLQESLDPAHIVVPLNTSEFWSANFNTAFQNDFRASYVKDYTESLATSVRKYITSGQAAAFLQTENLAILTQRVCQDFELMMFQAKPTAPMVRLVLLNMLEFK